MFMHFSMCTFADCEQDTNCRKNPASLFNPSNVNTTQWMETAVALGAKEICLTSHHTGGFALFQTNYSSYGIKESPYQGGKGDIVKEFVNSCRQYNISPCLYFINAWDCWDSQDSADVYLSKQLGMLSDLMNRERYGMIDRFWFDQFGFPSRPNESPPGLFPNAWSQIVDHVHNNSPGTMMLPGPDGCLTPSESGDGHYPIYNYVDDTLHCSYSAPPTNANGSIYVPFESDLSIQNPGDAWFWHKGHVFDSSSNLLTKYLATSGRGSHFILNMPPNTTGLIPQEFVDSVSSLGKGIRSTFDTNVGAVHEQSGDCDKMSVEVQSSGSFDTIMLIEDLTAGQQVLSYSIEIKSFTTGQWSRLTLDPSAGGLTVGSKNILQLSSTYNTSIRFNCTSAVGGPIKMETISLHKFVKPPGPPVTLRSYFSPHLNDTVPVATRDPSVYIGAGYSLLGSEVIVWNGPAPNGSSVKLLLEYDQNIEDNSMTNMDPIFTPKGYDLYAQDDSCYVYTDNAPGRIPIDAFYNTQMEDFWIIGSNASRQKALSLSYKYVGTLGYGLPVPNPE